MWAFHNNWHYSRAKIKKTRVSAIYPVSIFIYLAHIQIEIFSYIETFNWIFRTYKISTNFLVHKRLSTEFFKQTADWYKQKIKMWLISHLILNRLNYTKILSNFEQNWVKGFEEYWKRVSAVCLQKLS